MHFIVLKVTTLSMGIDAAIKDFLLFLKNPQYAYKSDEPLGFGMSTMLYMLVFFVILFISSPLMYLVGVENMQHSVDELLDNYPKWVFVLLTVVVAPISEELIFRWHLRQPLAILYVVAILLCGGMAYAYQEQLIAYWSAVIGVVFIISLIILLLYSIELKDAITRFYNRFFPLVFYLTVVVFALAHLGNFSDVDRWYVAPVLVLPQAMVALFLGYVRVRNNIFWSIYFHAFHNMIPSVLFLMMPDAM